MINSRLHYLDFLRASMLILGVAVHASLSDADGGELEPVRFFSELFRMGCFFILSGYFTTLIYHRFSKTDFYRKRLTLTLVPAIFAVIILVPVSNHLMDIYFTKANIGNNYYLSWMGHAWFLYALTIYTVIFPVLETIVKRYLKYIERFSGKHIPIAFGILFMVMTCIVLRKVSTEVMPYLGISEYHQFFVTEVIYYFPLFITGIAMFQNKESLPYITSRQNIWLVCSVLSVSLLAFLLTLEYESRLSQIIYHNLVHPFLRYSSAFSLSAFFIALTYRFMSNHNPVTRLISESSYSVYLIHYVLVAGTLLILQGLNLDIYSRFLVAFILASVIGVVVHHSLIKRFSVLTLLINGKSTK